MNTQTVTLSDGRTLTLREPLGGDLRGVKLLEVFQLEAGACARLLERVTDLSPAEFFALPGADAVTVMGGLMSFFGGSQMPSFPQPSTTESN